MISTKPETKVQQYVRHNSKKISEKIGKDRNNQAFLRFGGRPKVS